MFKKSSKSTISNEEVLDYLLKESKKFLPETEFIPITKAYNRVLASDIYSDIDIPGANTSSRDGFCLKASSVEGCNLTFPISLPIKKGEVHAGHYINSIEANECAYIATGGVLPQGADTVVPFENLELNEKENIAIFRSIPQKGDYVRFTASEMKKGEMVAKKYSKIEPELAGKIVSAGTFIVEVFKKIVVGIITSGDEIVMPWEMPMPWEVRTSNPTVMALLIEKYGGKCLDFGVAKDTGENMIQLFNRAIKASNIVVTSGGIAMGRHDPVRNMFEQLGIESVFQKYGSHFRPVFYSEYMNKPVFALPGTPNGMYRIFEKFVGPFLDGIVSA